MSSGFDLNIKNYNIHELEEILELPPNYDTSIVEMKETKLRQNIMNDPAVESAIKSKTVQFLSDAKKKLITNIQQKTGPKTSSPIVLPSTISGGAKAPETATEADEEVEGLGLIQHKVDPYILSNPSKYFKGQYNPLDKRIIKKSVNIDTRFRDNYYNTSPSNFQIEFPMKFNNVVSMQLAAMELPTSFYNIDKGFGNNFFALIDPDTSITQMIIIPDGNYNYAALINEVNRLIDAIPTVRLNLDGSDLPNIIPYIVFALDINQESGSGRVIVSFGKSSTSDIGTKDYTFILNFQTDINGQEDRTTPLPLKFGWMLGFRNGCYVNNVTYISEGLIDLSAPRYVFLSIDDHNNSVSDGFYSIYSSSVLNKNVLARISVRGNVFNYMAQNNLSTTTYPREYFGPVNLQKMTIQLLDEYGRILNLHQMDYSFCLTFDTIYDF